MLRLGLIDEDGALTTRGNKWRVDASFAEACQEILDDLYPAELEALVESDGRPDVGKIKTWFDHKGFGDSNARQMAATYAMVASKELPDAASTVPAEKPSRKAPAKVRATPPAASKEAAPNPGAARSPSSELAGAAGPNIHLDIQIHIPAEASPEQIDHIFASMAKHLYAK